MVIRCVGGSGRHGSGLYVVGASMTIVGGGAGGGSGIAAARRIGAGAPHGGRDQPIVCRLCCALQVPPFFGRDSGTGRPAVVQEAWSWTSGGESGGEACGVLRVSRTRRSRPFWTSRPIGRRWSAGSATLPVAGWKPVIVRLTCRPNCLR